MSRTQPLLILYSNVQFLVPGFSKPFHFVCEDIPSKLLTKHVLPSDMECIFLKLNLQKLKCFLGSNYMIPVCRDEISTDPVGTDFNLRLLGEIEFHLISARADGFPSDFCLDFHISYFNLSL